MIIEKIHIITTKKVIGYETDWTQVLEISLQLPENKKSYPIVASAI